MDIKDKEEQLQVIYSGIDTLDVSFKGAFPLEVLEKLKIAKDEAQNESREVLCDIGQKMPIQVQVAETGRRGGYLFRFTTGDDGEIWFIKKSQNKEQWNISCSVRAMSLAQYGYEGVKTRLYQFLENVGAWVLEESIARVDFAIDFIAPDFSLIPENFVIHSNASMRIDKELDNSTTKTVSLAMSGGSYTGVTLGKMPNRQLVIYDKRKEVIKKQNDFWWKVWGLDKDDTSNKIWRLELRAGKKHLKETWGIATWKDLEEKLGDILINALNKNRLVNDRFEDSNITRCLDHAMWFEAKKLIKQKLFESVNGQVPYVLIETEKEKVLNTYTQHLFGLMASYANLIDIDIGNITQVSEVIAKQFQTHTCHAQDRVEKSYRRASERYHFINQSNGEKYDGINGIIRCDARILDAQKAGSSREFSHGYD